MALSYKNDEQQDERLSPYSDSVKQLRDQENSGSDYDRTNDGLDDHPVSYGDASGKPGDLYGGASKNIDDAKDKEERAGNWTMNDSGNDEGTKGKVKGFLKSSRKKGPMAAIAAILTVCGVGLGGILTPGLALVHVKEVVAKKVDTMSSVVEKRSGMIMNKRTMNTTATCVVKVKCRYTGLTERQKQRLDANGAKLVDADGNPVTKDPVTRKYTGGATLILEDGTRIDAKSYKGALLSSSNLRDLNRSVYAPRWMSWNDKISKDIRAKKKLVTKPDWGSDSEDEKTKAKAIRQSVAKTQTPDPAAIDNTGIKDLPESSDISSEASKLQTSVAAGEAITPLPSNPVDVAQMPNYPTSTTVSGTLSSVATSLSALNTISIACTAYTYANTIVVTAKLVQLTSAMVYASQFLSTADKIKAGDASPGEVEKAMSVLQKEDSVGDSFGDSTGYQWAEYGKAPEKDIRSSASGNETTQMINASIGPFGFGHKNVVKKSCGAINSTSGIALALGASALAAFFSGGGSIAAQGAAKAAEKAGESTAKYVIKQAIDKVVSATVEKTTKKIADYATIKGAMRNGVVDFYHLARGPAGIFFGIYMLDKYGIPYLAHQIAGAALSGSEDGVTAMDTIANGADATNAATAQERGLAPLKKDEYTAFNNFNNNATSTYVADMRAQSNPFDLNNPYSDGNAMATAYQTFTSKLAVFKNGSFDFISAPFAILSNLNPTSILASSAHADDTSDELSQCQDDYLQAQNLATSPFCNVKYGFNDTSMLENTDPEQVVDYMTSNKQIDDNEGNPVAGSDYADFKSKCIDGAADKFIGDQGDPSINIDEQCYGAKNKTEEYKMFRLYTIDSSINDGMDNPPSATGADAAGADSSTTPVTGDTQSLAKQIIASPNIQFQTAAEKPLFQNIADTGKQTLISGSSPIDGSPIVGCDGTTQVPISSKLMSVLLAASQKYKLTLGVVASGHNCDGLLHPQGQAIDINGVAHLDQPFVQRYDWTGDQVAMAKEFYEFLDTTAGKSNIQLELGQKSCFANTPPQLSHTQFVKDDCSHIHVGVTSP